MLEASLQRSQDVDPGVRARAARELGELGHRDREPALRTLRALAVRDRSPEVRLAARSALDELGAGRPLAEDVEELDAFQAMTTAALLDTMDDPSRAVFERAAEMLAEREDPSLVPKLWDKFFRYTGTDLDRAEVILDVLESQGQEVDQARQALAYIDPIDWQTFSAELRAQFPPPPD